MKTVNVLSHRTVILPRSIISYCHWSCHLSACLSVCDEVYYG